jgi:hypothetical protein
LKLKIPSHDKDILLVNFENRLLMNEVVGVTEVQDPEQSPRDFKRSSIKNGTLPPLNLSPRSPRKRTESMNAKIPKLDSKSPVKEKSSRLSLKSTSSDKFPDELLDSPGADEIKPQLPRFFNFVLTLRICFMWKIKN